MIEGILCIIGAIVGAAIVLVAYRVTAGERDA